MDLNEIRKKIDELDGKIIKLLNERTKLVLEIGKIKGEKGGEVYAPDRESAIYRKIDEIGKGPMPADSLKAIYKEIMSASISLEKPVRVAYLGPEATFTHLAALSKFGQSVNYVAAKTISDVFSEVDKKNADYGVIPIENSTEGAVNYTLDVFVDSDLKICSEIVQEIKHNLLSNSKLQDIKRVYSNPQVFGQCRIWLETNLPRVSLIDTSSTAEAAQRAASEAGTACIASSLAATLYNLNVVAESIEDAPHNMTRFLVVSRQIPAPTDCDKTSIVVSIKDKVGALYEMLQPIKKHKVNMTKIESRPSKKRAWDYYFFIDMEGHIEDKNVKKTINEIEDRVRFLKVLGSYPVSG